MWKEENLYGSISSSETRSGWKLSKVICKQKLIINKIIHRCVDRLSPTGRMKADCFPLHLPPPIKGRTSWNWQRIRSEKLRDKQKLLNYLLSVGSRIRRSSPRSSPRRVVCASSWSTVAVPYPDPRAKAECVFHCRTTTHRARSPVSAWHPHRPAAETAAVMRLAATIRSAVCHWSNQVRIRCRCHRSSRRSWH